VVIDLTKFKDCITFLNDPVEEKVVAQNASTKIVDADLSNLSDN
jgi:hypothetical protein